MNLADIKNLNLPIAPGSYQFYNATGKIVYIGKAANLASRVLSYWQKSASLTPAKYSMLKRIVRIKWIETESEIEALLLEANLVKKYQPDYNVLLRDDKRFAYIKISLDDEIPGVFITRIIDKSGKYFGPFTSALAVRETLRALRKIFPYCLERKIKERPCFYYQLGRCLGICAGKISREDYVRQVIRPLVMFLEGKKGRIIKNYELRIRNLEKVNKKLDSEGATYLENQKEIGELKYQLANMKQVLEGAKVIGVADKYANDVVELAKILGLPKIPERIEGYDIANIFGKEAAGSMVVFSGGESNKNEYRKFKIKIGQGQANDIGMLKEVLERRFKHTSPQPSPYKGEGGNWPLPDLIVIDGGKAQLNAAVRILKKRRLEIPLVAISKGLGLRSSVAPDKLFFPGEKKPLELPLASPALHLIKRVRDEAHRFAIGYHRKLRSRAEFG
ncbi:excinuclease ABC subunit UvrC [Candidatus Falkowbacteria bacterium]|nr:excinuclease ABC subunit UvrC [Candidatus Falkowbacteria bacterium]